MQKGREMLIKRVTQVYAVLIGALAVAGLFVSGQLLNLMNVDLALDLVRVVLAAGLVYAGFIAKDERVAQSALLFVGLLYISMGLLGLATPTFGGVLPSGLT